MTLVETSIADATDRLLLDEAAIAIAGAAAGEIVTIGDDDGALTLGTLAAGASGVRVFQDSLASEQSLQAQTRAGSATNLTQARELLAGARVVLLKLPKSLAELDDIATDIAAFAAPDVVVFAGGRIKHMSLSMNEVLKRHFARLDVTHARQKSRVLVAREPIAGGGAQLRREFSVELALWICATGSTFAGTKLDIGTRALLAQLPQVAPDATSAVDLGCGSGVVAAVLARSRPALQVLATDVSAGAVASTTATIAANGLTNVTVLRDDALSTRPDDSTDLVVLNPPFHDGTALSTATASKLFAAASRVLRPGGQLVTVYNSHLGSRAELERVVGATRQLSRTTKFTVTLSTRSHNARSRISHKAGQ
jgi:16S rRNA (guanine1207-N2)-methyltransferase